MGIFLQVGIIAAFIALWRRKPRWDQDHVDTDENLPTIFSATAAWSSKVTTLV